MDYVDKLVQDLMSLKYEYKSEYIRNHMSPVIKPEHEHLIRSAVNKYANEFEVEIAKLEAKVRMYEIAIGNSNFKPMFESVLKSNTVEPLKTVKDCGVE